MQASDILGTAEVARLAGVSVAAVANWSKRGLLTPSAILQCGPIYELATVQRFLDLSGRTGLDRASASEGYELLAAVRKQVRAELLTLSARTSEIFDYPAMARPSGKISGDGRGNGQAEYDWFYALSRVRRSQLAKRYMIGGDAPDQWALKVSPVTGSDDVEECVSYWLAAIDLVDAIAAVLAGRETGGALELVSAQGFKVSELFGKDGARYLATFYADERDRYAFTDVSTTDTYHECEVF